MVDARTTSRQCRNAMHAERVIGKTERFFSQGYVYMASRACEKRAVGETSTYVPWATRQWHLDGMGGPG